MKQQSDASLSPALRVAVNGIGIALYVALSLAVQMPVFKNYYLCLGYVVLALYCWQFGPAAGALVGTLGCVLHALAIGGLRGLPGWALGNLFIGLTLGLLYRHTLKKGTGAARLAACAAGTVLITAIAMLGVKSLVEVILYAQPMWLRVLNNFYAFAADAAVLVLSIPLCLMSGQLTGSLYRLGAGKA